MIPLNSAWRVVVSMRSSKDSSRFFTVEAVALQNLPQTLRGRERSKRGYASPLLVPTCLGTEPIPRLGIPVFASRGSGGLRLRASRYRAMARSRAGPEPRGAHPPGVCCVPGSISTFKC